MGVYCPLDNSLGLCPRPIISRAVYAQTYLQTGRYPLHNIIVMVLVLWLCNFMEF